MSALLASSFIETLKQISQKCQTNHKSGNSQILHLKADLHYLNLGRTTDTFLWRTLSFQSLFEEEEICIICKSTCFVYLGQLIY